MKHHVTIQVDGKPEPKRRYYLAGPMRGYDQFNFPAFHHQARLIRAFGHEVFSPTERDIEVGFDTKDMDGSQETIEEFAAIGFDLREALASDSEFICLHATHIHMLAGWSKSNGARAEWALAVALGLVVEGAAA